MKKKSKSKRSSPRGQRFAEALETRLLFTLTPISFASATSFVAGTAPIGVVAADFNSDGFMDLAVADKSTDKVDVFFGNGTGSFTAGPVLSLSAPPSAIITGDFNGDGKPDIAVACTAATGQSTTSVDVFLNTGGGTFGLGQITNVETGATPGEPVGLATGNFNGSGHEDLVVTEYSAQSIAILFGNGNGTFQTPVDYSADQYPTAVAAADFNDDGYSDIAVTSTSVNVLAGATNDGTATNQVSLIQNTASSPGNFTVGANLAINSTTGTPDSVETANLTGASTPGLLVGNTDGTVTVFTNTAGNFATSAQVGVGGGTTGVAAGDFNLDGDTDFVSSNGGNSLSNSSNTVTVVPGIGNGMVSEAQQLGTGVSPADVVVADFNNDGKPDIATANEGDGTVSILLNNTSIPLVATSVAVTSSGLSSPAGSAVTFTATVTGASASPLPGESIPTGTVKFYDGSTLLGSPTLVPGTDQVQLTTSDLTVGSHRVGVVFSGDTAYGASASVRIVQVISPTATEGPDLVGSLSETVLPATLASGETGTVKVQISNQGNTTAVGVISNDVYLSLDQAVDSSDTLLSVRGSLARTSLHLAAGKSITLSGTITIPQNASLATYYLLVQVNATGSLAESVSTNNTAVSPTQYTVANVFGSVAGKAGVTLKVDDSNGTPATFRLTGPGNGAVNISNGSVQIVLDGTTTASVLTVSGTGGFTAADLTADSPIGTIRAPLLSVTNSLALPDGATAVTLQNVGISGNNGLISIGSGTAPTLTFASVPGMNLNAAGGIKSVSATNWGTGAISAGWIGSLRSRQQFGASVLLSGVGAPAGLSLSSATVGGMAAGSWNITGNTGSIALASTPTSPTAWGLDVSGALKSLAVNSTLYGSVLADSIGSVAVKGLNGAVVASDTSFASILIRGSLSGSDVLAATSGPGVLGSIRVTGSVTDGFIAADAGTSSAAPITVGPNGTIKSVTVLGSVDATTKFLAAVLPKRAVLAGAAVLPAMDPHFQV
jgi:hypothetical protein